LSLDSEIAHPEGASGVATPLTVAIGEQCFDLGTTQAWLTDPALVERREHGGQAYYSFTTPGRVVRYRCSDRPQVLGDGVEPVFGGRPGGPVAEYGKGAIQKSF
jgi:hypothetical protein